MSQVAKFSPKAAAKPKGPYLFHNPAYASSARTMQRFKWFGVLQLCKTRTDTLVKRWQVSHNSAVGAYYDMFPTLWPKHYPKDHPFKNYKESEFTNLLCDFSTLTEKPVKAYFNTKCADCNHQRNFIASDDGDASYGICDRCELVWDALAGAWLDDRRQWLCGKPMPKRSAKDFASLALTHKRREFWARSSSLTDDQWLETLSTV
jgi:hypothetical protein